MSNNFSTSKAWVRGHNPVKADVSSLSPITLSIPLLFYLTFSVNTFALSDRVDAHTHLFREFSFVHRGLINHSPASEASDLEKLNIDYIICNQIHLRHFICFFFHNKRIAHFDFIFYVNIIMVSQTQVLLCIEDLISK